MSVKNDVTEFLKDTDWANVSINWFDADWSVRRYARLTPPPSDHDKGDKGSAILLQSPPDNAPNAMVGHMIGEWSHVNHHFKSLGLNVPTIIKEDLSKAFILMEDFGVETLSGKGMSGYQKATDILIAMRDHPLALDNNFIRYENTHVYKALRFYPRYISECDENKWFEAWKKVEQSLPPCPRALTHIDYHPANLMWNKGHIGIIDFQAACDGPFVYDIVNLLEDIRTDVPNDIKQACQNHYRQNLSADKKILFGQWYPIITAQFYARILGQVQFLSQEKGRHDLMQYYEPITRRFHEMLTLPLLSPIADLV